jgi:hypothetical protein
MNLKRLLIGHYSASFISGMSAIKQENVVIVHGMMERIKVNGERGNG